MNYKYTYILDNNNCSKTVEARWLKRKGFTSQTIKLWNYLCKGGLRDLSDEKVRSSINIGKAGYERYKQQLVMAGLLEVHRVNASTIVYLVGLDAIHRNHKVNWKRELQRINRITLEYLGYETDLELPEETTTDEVHADYDISNLLKLVQVPEPIGDVKVL